MSNRSQNGTVDVLSGLRLPPIYVWVECEREEINEGLTRPLRIKVLVNPSRAEIVSLAQQVETVINASADRLRKRLEAAEKARSAGKPVPSIYDAEADRQDDYALAEIIAHRIVDWNLQALNENDEIVDVPPPAEAGGIVMELLNTRQRQWILQIVQMAHLGGETRSKLSRRPVTTESTEAGRTPSGPQIVSTPTGDQPQSHRKSS